MKNTAIEAFEMLKTELRQTFPEATIRNPHDRKDVIECFLTGMPVADALIVALVQTEDKNGVALSLENNGVPLGGDGYSFLNIELSQGNVGEVITKAKQLMCVPA